MKKYELKMNNAKYYYWVLNPRGKNTALLIHGFRGNHKGLTALAERLEGHRVIIPDLPGYGKSPSLKHNTITNYAKFIKNFINKLKIEKFDLVGHSYGASISIVFAALYRHNINKLVLITPVSEAETLLAKMGLAYYNIALVLPSQIRHKWLASQVFSTLSGELLLKNPNYKKRAEIIVRLNRNLKEIHDPVVIENYLSLFHTPIYSLARHIKSNTLIIAGEADKIAPPDAEMKFNSLIKNSKIEIIKKAGHLVPLESPAAVANAINNFLRL